MEMVLGATFTESACTATPSRVTCQRPSAHSSSTVRILVPEEVVNWTSSFMACGPVGDLGHRVSIATELAALPRKLALSLHLQFAWHATRPRRSRQHLRCLLRRCWREAGVAATHRAKWCEFRRSQNRTPPECGG